VLGYQTNFSDQYELGKELGRGGNGVVRLAVHKPSGALCHRQRAPHLLLKHMRKVVVCSVAAGSAGASRTLPCRRKQYLPAARRSTPCVFSGAQAGRWRSSPSPRC
jgi:serine/threonine protein kinase